MNPSQTSSIAPRKIHIIVVAMTQAELPPMVIAADRRDVKEKILYDFLGLLAENDIEDVRQRYGDKRGEWRPFGNESNTVKNLVEKFLETFCKEYALEPDFGMAEDFFDLDPVKSQMTWTKLGKERFCFLLVDGISLHHSRIRSTIINALGVVGQRTAMVVLSPFDSTSNPVHSSLIKLVEMQCQSIMARYRYAFDPRVDILAGGMFCFHRWLKASIHRTIAEIEQQKMVPEKRTAMKNLQPISHGDYL
jgi:hypothetical protein